MKRLIFLLTSIWLLLICRSVQGFDKVDHSFGKATAGQAIFVIGFDPNSPKVSMRAGLRFKLSEGVFDSQGVKTVFGISGDGRAELRFQISKLTVPSQGWGSGVQLRVDFLDQQKSGITVARQTERNGSSFVMVDFTSNGMEQHQVRKFGIQGPVILSEVSGLAIDRTAKMIDVEVLVNGRWVKLLQEECSPQMIHPIAVWCGTGGGKAELDITLKQLVVTGADLVTKGHEESSPLSIWSLLMYFSVALLVITMLWNLRGRWLAS